MDLPGSICVLRPPAQAPGTNIMMDSRVSLLLMGSQVVEGHGLTRTECRTEHAWKRMYAVASVSAPIRVGLVPWLREIDPRARCSFGARVREMEEPISFSTTRSSGSAVVIRVRKSSRTSSPRSVAVTVCQFVSTRCIAECGRSSRDSCADAHCGPAVPKCFIREDIELGDPVNMLALAPTSPPPSATCIIAPVPRPRRAASRYVSHPPVAYVSRKRCGYLESTRDPRWIHGYMQSCTSPRWHHDTGYGAAVTLRADVCALPDYPFLAS
jgi:hypothetical protein